MKWKKAPEKLIMFLETTLKDIDCEYRKMFGYPAYFINKHMFIGAFQDDLYLRLSDLERGKITARHKDIKPFEPMPGRKMKEYLIIPADIYKNNRVFSGMLKKSVEYVSSLPPKKKK